MENYLFHFQLSYMLDPDKNQPVIYLPLSFFANFSSKIIIPQNTQFNFLQFQAKIFRLKNKGKGQTLFLTRAGTTGSQSARHLALFTALPQIPRIFLWKMHFALTKIDKILNTYFVQISSLDALVFIHYLAPYTEKKLVKVSPNLVSALKISG